MTEQHPTALPPELVQQWENAWYAAKVKHESLNECVATQAARWGYEQAVTELETCLRDYPMTEQHPITPPPELVDQWWGETGEVGDAGFRIALHIATQAARWGADQELEACLTEVSFFNSRAFADKIRAARRPKPPSLKEQALGALYAIATGADDTREFHQDLETIKHALEALPDA